MAETPATAEVLISRTVGGWVGASLWQLLLVNCAKMGRRRSTQLREGRGGIVLVGSLGRFKPLPTE